ncbi:SWIM zinc finger family protein [Corynebacterium sp. UBA2622]|uniref:SWIM zinc finger family protein n=1 Tax=Corynebacterium sp. UBA2622 TaxID=1946393 RepID=UPI0025C38CB9|nr:SWIM zinc finger family protein [Corynebacterium sp. UBA2622]
MAERPSEDNVIYANFGARRRVERPEEAGSTGESVVPIAGHSRAARRVLLAALRNTDPQRAKRGQQYVQEGKVLEVTPRPAGFDGVVAGSQNDPFTVSLQLPRRSARDIQQALEHLARRAGSVEKAKRGEFDEEVLSLLIAPDDQGIRFYCTCPDSAPVCKHAVAVAEKAAELIDADPSVVFALRGLSLPMIEQGVRNQAAAVAKENSAEGSEYFWSGRELPELPRPKVAPMVDDSDLDLLHRAMQTVSFTNIDQMRAVADIEDLYDELTR